jgi:cytochrome c
MLGPEIGVEDHLRQLPFFLVFSAIGAGSTAIAADADNGKRLAEARCVTCHNVGLVQRREVADAPPFETIARKFAFSPELLAFAMLEPHPRMNVALTRREAQDIAAYINTLAK